MADESSLKRPDMILVADYKERFIWFEGKNLLVPSLAAGIISILNRLNKLSNEPIFFYISGIGGDVLAFLKIANAIEKIKSPVIFVAFKLVRSGCFMITQCGKTCFAVAGTKLIFHRSIHSWSGDIYMSQKDYLTCLRNLMLIDAVQFMIFSKRGSPIKTLLGLFEQEAILSVEKAIGLNLVAGVYEKKDFYKHKRIAKKLIQKKYDL